MIDGVEYRIPGSFPTYESNSQEYDQIKINRSGSVILDEQLQEQFCSKQITIRKTRNQHELLIQLDGIIKILIGYQFVKFTHSSCLTPLILRAFFLVLLTPSQVTTNEGIFYFQVMSQYIENPSVRQDIKKLIISNFCRSFYLISLMISIYYITTMFAWLLPLAASGDLSQIQHGSWWFISFIGESTPSDITPEMNIWLKLYKLGFFGLLITEFLILFLQLILFQCIFKQTTMGDRHLNEDEVYLIRSPKDLLSIPSNIIPDYQEVPTILKVKLYEVLNVDSYELH